MPASRVRAALPGWHRAAALALFLMLPGLVAAQDSPAPRAGAAARPNAGAVGPGTGPLQTEPGDIWAEVRGWTQGRGKAEPAPSRPRRAAPCAAEEPGCTRKPARTRANPG